MRYAKVFARQYPLIGSMLDPRTMPDVALIGEKSFLYEKLFGKAEADCLYIKPELLGSPYLPRFKLLMIPTGFANPQYSRVLPALRRCREGLARFIEGGGVLIAFGPHVAEHDYDWLCLPMGYIAEYGSAQALSVLEDDPLCCFPSTGDCDGYLHPGKGFRTLIEDSQGRPVLAVAEHGEGLVVITSIHEFPPAEMIRRALARGKLASF